MGSISSLLGQSRYFSNTYSHLSSSGKCHSKDQVFIQNRTLQYSNPHQCYPIAKGCLCKAMYFRMFSQLWNFKHQSVRATPGSLKDLDSIYETLACSCYDNNKDLWLFGGRCNKLNRMMQVLYNQVAHHTLRSVWFEVDNLQTLLTWEMSMHITGSLCPYNERKN